MNAENVVTLESLCGGAAAELFQRELAMVVENIMDINTDDKPREVTLKLVIAPDARRHSGQVKVVCFSKLGKLNQFNSTFYFARASNGQAVALEHNPDQLKLDLEQPKPELVSFQKEA